MRVFFSEISSNWWFFKSFLVAVLPRCQGSCKSGVTCQVTFFYNEVELVGWGSVIKGALPIHFFFKEKFIQTIFFRHLSIYVSYHVYHVMYHMSGVICPMSHVTCHVSCVTCQMSHVFWLKVSICIQYKVTSRTQTHKHTNTKHNNTQM